MSQRLNLCLESYIQTTRTNRYWKGKIWLNWKSNNKNTLDKVYLEFELISVIVSGEILSICFNFVKNCILCFKFLLLVVIFLGCAGGWNMEMNICIVIIEWRWWWSRTLCLTLVAVTVSPANGTRALSEKAPGVGFTVRVSAVIVFSQASARILLHIIRKLCPFQAWRAWICLRHCAIVVAQLSKTFWTGERDCKMKEKTTSYSSYIIIACELTKETHTVDFWNPSTLRQIWNLKVAFNMRCSCMVAQQVASMSQNWAQVTVCPEFLMYSLCSHVFPMILCFFNHFPKTCM